MKTKQILLIAGMLLFIQAIFAQIPPGYYNTATGTGATLKTQLYNIIKGHTSVSYDQLWTSYYTTDRRADGKMWDIYTDNCNFTYSTDQCGNYQNVCDCYNREHSFPKSWFNEDAPMVSDIFHIYPTDGKVNGMRSNYPFGNTAGGAVWGNGKLGTCTFPGYTGIVFEPADQYKGDLARTYFYMATRYQDIIADWEAKDPSGDAMLDGTNFPCFEPWALALLISWNNLDPVSQKEIDRNNAIYTSVQHNRNPYIDHPEWVNTVWGSGTTVAVTSITVNSAGNATTISTPLGTLQMSAVVAPSTATNQTYTWSVVAGTGTASINTSGLLTATTNGTVTVKATANDGSNVFGTKLITLSNQTVGVAQYQGASNITFYPNPVENVLTIDLSSTSALPELIWISDVTGKVVYQTTPDHSKISIDMTNLNKGVYFLNFNSKQTKTTYKLVH